MQLITEAVLGPGHTVLDGDPAAHACCGETAGWIKMPLGWEVGLCSLWKQAVLLTSKKFTLIRSVQKVNNRHVDYYTNSERNCE